MRFSVVAVVIILVGAIVFAKPAPKAFKVGWHEPLAPENDCKFTRGTDSLTIEVPGTDHDYDTRRDQLNAPRLLRDIEGDFLAEVRVRINGLPSVESTVDKHLPSIAAGFLLIFPGRFGSFYRLEYGLNRQGKEVDRYAAMKLRSTNAVWPSSWKNWPLSEKAEYAYLRLERRGDKFYPSLSPDGKKWTLLSGGGGILGLPPKIKVGLAAYTTSKKPFKAQFDQFKLTQNRQTKPK